MKLALGGDHAGFAMKEPVRAFLAAAGHAVTDFGTHSSEPVDFPDIAKLVCGAVRGARTERGVLVCGPGVGACIAANKVPGIRAAVCHDVYSARQCVEHDDVNLLCLGAQIVGVKLAEEILASYLRAQFSTEDHFRRRVAKLGEMERAAARELGGHSVG